MASCCAQVLWGGFFGSWDRNVVVPRYGFQFGRRNESLRLVVCAKKKKRKDLMVTWESAEDQEIVFNTMDLHQIRLRRMLGQPREVSIASVILLKLNPHLDSLDVQKVLRTEYARILVDRLSNSAAEAARKSLITVEEMPEDDGGYDVQVAKYRGHSRINIFKDEEEGTDDEEGEDPFDLTAPTYSEATRQEMVEEGEDEEEEEEEEEEEDPKVVLSPKPKFPGLDDKEKGKPMFDPTARLTDSDLSGWKKKPSLNTMEGLTDSEESRRKVLMKLMGNSNNQPETTTVDRDAAKKKLLNFMTEKKAPINEDSEADPPEDSGSRKMLWDMLYEAKRNMMDVGPRRYIYEFGAARDTEAFAKRLELEAVKRRGTTDSQVPSEQDKEKSSPAAEEEESDAELSRSRLLEVLDEASKRGLPKYFSGMGDAAAAAKKELEEQGTISVEKFLILDEHEPFGVTEVPPSVSLKFEGAAVPEEPDYVRVSRRNNEKFNKKYQKKHKHKRKF